MNNSSGVSQRIIGLTGGIAMGKTAVANYLASAHHLPILDADFYARDAVAPGSLVLEAIRERYGSGVLLPDGQLNRARLGDIIFNSVAERLWVEQCIHPYVRDRLVEAINTLPLSDSRHYPTVVMVIPLLFEARMTDLVTETWVVICPKEQQLARLIHRDHLTKEQAQARINSQMDVSKKAERATVVLDNSASLEELFIQVDEHLKRSPSSSRTFF